MADEEKKDDGLSPLGRRKLANREGKTEKIGSPSVSKPRASRKSTSKKKSKKAGV